MRWGLSRVGPPYVALILALATLCVPVHGHTQQANKVWRVGVLMPERPGALEALLEGLRTFRYVEGQNLMLEHRRFSRSDQMPALAAELVRLNPDVMVAGAGRAALALKAATKTIPIVMANSSDAVTQGLVASLARPGGNVTGLTILSPELAAKRLEILTEAAPKARRIAVLGCPDTSPVSKKQWREVDSAAKRRGRHIVPLLVRRSDELAAAFEQATRQGIDAVLSLDCGNLPPAEYLTGLVNRARLPAMYPFPRYAEAGGLMAYGPNTIENYRRAAFFVDKILKGAIPADLPVEQATTFELVINERTATALGLTVPHTLLLRADHVIK